MKFYIFQDNETGEWSISLAEFQESLKASWGIGAEFTRSTADGENHTWYLTCGSSEMEIFVSGKVQGVSTESLFSEAVQFAFWFKRLMPNNLPLMIYSGSLERILRVTSPATEFEALQFLCGRLKSWPPEEELASGSLPLNEFAADEGNVVNTLSSISSVARKRVARYALVLMDTEGQQLKIPDLNEEIAKSWRVVSPRKMMPGGAWCCLRHGNYDLEVTFDLSGETVVLETEIVRALQFAFWYREHLPEGGRLFLTGNNSFSMEIIGKEHLESAIWHAVGDGSVWPPSDS